MQTPKPALPTIRRPRKRQRPEHRLQRVGCRFLKVRGGCVDSTHGSMFQSGWPDTKVKLPQFAFEHWIDWKIEGQYTFTKAQRTTWPRWDRAGIGIWILTDCGLWNQHHDYAKIELLESEYHKLFGPPNWKDYWKDSWGKLPTETKIDAAVAAMWDDADEGDW
jgi:hypothetical protein